MRDRDGMDSNYVARGMQPHELLNEIAQLRAEKRCAMVQLYRVHVDKGGDRWHNGVEGYEKWWDTRYGVA